MKTKFIDMNAITLFVPFLNDYFKSEILTPSISLKT